MRPMLLPILAVCACRGSGDALAPDAEPPRVTVQTVIEDRTTPAASIQVVFHDAAGAPLALVETDDTGTASLQQHGIAAVTAVYPEAQFHEAALVTITGITGDDDLVIARPIRTPVGASSTLPPMNVAITPYPDALGYLIESPCPWGTPPYGGTSQELTLDSRCDTSTGPFRVVVLARADYSLPPLASSVVETTYASGGTVNVTDWQEAVPFDVTYSNVEAFTMSAHHVVFDDARELELFQVDANADFDGLAQSIATDLEGLEGMRSAYRPGGATLGQRFHGRVTGDSYALDVGSSMLPTVADYDWDGARTVSWSETGGRPAALHVVEVGIFPTDVNPYTWFVHGPADQPSVTLPELPAELAEYENASDYQPTMLPLLYDLDGASYADLHGTIARDLRDPRFLYGFDRAVVSGLSQP